MYRKEETFYSQCLNRDMTLMVYGHSGVPFIAFPCQDSMHDNFENFGMIDTLADYLEEGRMQLFIVDTVDRESWSDTNGDLNHRIWMQEQYFYYITNELVPWMYNVYGIGQKPFTMGFSLGATHAAICYFRRPDLFAGVLALAGIYDAYSIFGDNGNSLIYENSPIHFLPNLPDAHWYRSLYREGRIIISVGQGRWNEEGLRDIYRLREIFERQGIPAWTDIWGYDVDHDWPWWHKQVRYFLPHMIG